MNRQIISYMIRDSGWKPIKMSLIYSKVGFPGGAVVQNLPTNGEDEGSIPRSGRSPGGGNGNPLQYSCLEIPVDGGAWRATNSWGCKELDTTEWLHFFTLFPDLQERNMFQENYIWHFGARHCKKHFEVLNSSNFHNIEVGSFMFPILQMIKQTMKLSNLSKFANSKWL